METTAGSVIECPRCLAHNEPERLVCKLCNASLIDGDGAEGSPHVVLETVDASTHYVSTKKLIVLTLLLALTVFPWIALRSVFHVPEDVTAAQHSYQQLYASYQSEQERWHTLKEQILTEMARNTSRPRIGRAAIPFTGLPVQALIAFFEEDLGLQTGNGKLVIYPTSLGEAPRVLIAKQQKLLGLWKTYASLEFSLEMEEGKLSARPISLRWGSKKLPEGLAWDYFGNELAHLRKLEEFQGGIQQLHVYAPSGDQYDPTTLRASWVYKDQGFRGV